MVQTLTQARERGQHALETPTPTCWAGWFRGHDEVFTHAEIGKDATPLRNIGNTLAGKLVWLASGKILSKDLDTSFALRNMSQERPNQGALTHAVASKQPDCLSTGDLQIDPMQHVA
jgi:hypothetical protein